VALAQIGELDPSTLGLDDLGRPDDFLERQIARQRDLWTSFLEVDGYDPAWLPQVNETAAWLLDTIPADRRSGITHGDFHLSNLLFDRESPTLAAVLDWEMCTLGDPLVDLGWLMMCWPGADGPSIVPTGDRIVTLDAFPRRADVLPTFAEHSTRSLENLDWYIAFASFRFGIIIESNYMRALAGKISAELGQQSHDLGRRLLTVAADIAAGRWTIRDEMAATPLPRD
jgi:aminoglycoside phosphotransferase (APT) family kinase protein